MSDPEVNQNYVSERHGPMNLLQYCREKEPVVLAIIDCLPRFKRMYSEIAIFCSSLL